MPGVEPVVTEMPDPENSVGELLDLPSSVFLTLLQAAHHLGITAELSFAYTAGRLRAKSHRLETTENGGETRFKRAVLDEFDRYLSEPWTQKGEACASVPRCIENHLRVESSNQCTRCGSGQGVETAHIAAWDDSRSHHHNLIRLYKLCHVEYDQHKGLTVDEVREIKSRAIARTCEALRNRMIPIAARFQSLHPEGVLEGRTDEVNFLRDALRSSRAVLIQGPAGVDKTQLLVHALGRVETGRRVVWVDVDQAASAEAILTALQILLTNELQSAIGATFPNQLDALSACVVLDGVERANGLATETVDDLLDELKNNTVHAKFVVTSQVNLQRTVFDERRELAGLAYEQLNEGEKRTLYFIASCPGGMLTRQLKFNDHCSSKTPLSLAALRRWSLVQTKAKGEWDERSRMLSPIRSYVRQRWSEENAVDARMVT